MPVATARKAKARAPSPPVEASLPLGKQLVHTDRKVRDRAIQSLIPFLSRGAGDSDDTAEGSSGYVRLSDGEMAKLWKGLFYCYWMSDKPLIQQSLASDLSEFLLRINPASSGVDQFDAALAFLEGFWTAMVREWTGIDRLRMDKFYLLMRRYVNATFRLLAREGWSKEAVERVNGILSAKHGPVTWQDPSVPSSIATHLGDVYLEELDRVLCLPEVNSQPAAPLVALLQPHITLLARTRIQAVHTRVMSTLFSPLLDALSRASPSIDDDRPAKRQKGEPVFAHLIMGCCLRDSGSEARATPDELRRGVLKAMFDAAADEKAVDSNRRRIYKLWREEADDE